MCYYKNKDITLKDVSAFVSSMILSVELFTVTLVALASFVFAQEEDQTANKESYIEIEQAVNVCLAALLLAHLAALLALVLLQKPWRICCYPASAWRQQQQQEYCNT